MRGMSALLWNAAVSSSGSTVTARSASIVPRTCGSDGGAWPRNAVRRSSPGERSLATAASSATVAEALGSLLPCATATSTPSGMNTALRLAGAGPAAAARVRALLDAARAGGAADGRVAVVDQGVHQDALLGDEVVHLLLRPADDRVDLDHLPPVVPLDDLGLAAVAGLVPAHAGDPGVVVLQRPLERLDLAQVAAQVRVAAEQPRAERGVLLLDGARRGDVDQLDRVHRFHRVPGPDGLGEVVASVEEDHLYPRLDGRGEMDDHRVGHRRGDADALTERVHRPADHLFGRGVGEFLRSLFGEGSHELGILQGGPPRQAARYDGAHSVTPIPAKRSWKLRVQLRQCHSPSADPCGSRSSSPQ